MVYRIYGLPGLWFTDLWFAGFIVYQVSGVPDLWANGLVLEGLSPAKISFEFIP